MKRGHKGSAISTMVELLAGTMIGDLTSAEALDYLGTTTLAPHHGELVLAFSPERFSGSRRGDPFALAEVLFEAIAGQGARLPSQRRFTARWHLAWSEYHVARKWGLPLPGFGKIAENVAKAIGYGLILNRDKMYAHAGSALGALAGRAGRSALARQGPGA